MNCIGLKFCQSDGSLSVLLVGLKIIAVFGKTVKDIFTRSLKRLLLLLLRYYLINFKHVFNTNSLSKVKVFLVDGGYSGDKFANTIKKIHGATVKLVKRNELYQFGILPKRWIIEHSFSWLEKHRHLWKNCKRYLHTSVQMTSLTFIALLLNKF